tara:strand:- start:675 stop:1043 length:369 start_codon:yes stop_codon:yes gene_type:complete
MKIFKYMLFVVVLIFSVFFIIKLNELNLQDGFPIRIKIPYLLNIEGVNPDGIKVWEAIILTLSAGVFLGFIIALFQMISQKSEIISLKSKVRRLNSELDNLRNHDIDDEIDIIEENNEDTEI